VTFLFLGTLEAYLLTMFHTSIFHNDQIPTIFHSSAFHNSHRQYFTFESFTTQM